MGCGSDGGVKNSICSFLHFFADFGRFLDAVSKKNITSPNNGMWGQNNHFVDNGGWERGAKHYSVH